MAFHDVNPGSPHSEASGALPPWAALFPHFTRKKVLVAGDMMLDRFIWGQVTRISPEAPIPVVEVQRESAQPGGASNVVNNIGALGARTCMVGVVGDDEHGRVLIALLAQAGVDTSGIVVEADSGTTVKTRVVAHSQQLVRVDRERRSPLSGAAGRQLQESGARAAETADAVVFSDYAKGVLDEGLIQAIRDAAQRRRIPVVANAKPANMDLFRGITAIQVNQLEAEQSTGSPIRDDADVLRAGEALIRRTGVEHLIITCSARGMILFSREGDPHPVPPVDVPVYDAAGAGDTVISAFTLALSAGADGVLAAELASLAAGAAVRKVGVATVTAEEILHLFREIRVGAG